MRSSSHDWCEIKLNALLLRLFLACSDAVGITYCREQMQTYSHHKHIPLIEKQEARRDKNLERFRYETHGHVRVGRVLYKHIKYRAAGYQNTSKMTRELKLLDA